MRPNEVWESLRDAGFVENKPFALLSFGEEQTFSKMVGDWEEASVKEGYKAGTQDGHNEGYDSGHSTGYDKGHREGYAKGFQDGKVEAL